MRRIALFSSLLAALFAASPAAALPAGARFDAFLDHGPWIFILGTVRFGLSAQVPGGACRYGMRWSPLGEAMEATCAVDEAKMFGARSCAINALAALHSIVVRAPFAPCAGFDITGTRADVFQLVLGERAGDPDLVGLIQYTPANPSLYGFRASMAEEAADPPQASPPDAPPAGSDLR